MKSLSWATTIMLLYSAQAMTQPLASLSNDCLIEPSLSVELGSSVRGIADEILVKRGDRVKKGDLLVKLDSRVQAAAVELAKLRSNSTAELESKKESHQLALKILARYRDLYENNNVSVQQLEEATSKAVIAESDWHQAKENQLLAQLELKESEEVLALRMIKSPLEGVVVDRMISPGEIVNEDEPIMRLATLDPLHVEVILPAQDFGSILLGESAIVMPADPIGGEYVGKIDIVDTVIDAASGTFGVRIVLPNPAQKLPAGLGCRVDFNH